MKRSDEARGPLIVGRTYLVPTVRATWCGREADWPVMGPKHEDAEHFNFHWQHYHLDRRFLAREDDEVAAVSKPLAVGPQFNCDGLPGPVYRRRKCRRAHLDFPVYVRPVRALQAAYAGRQCPKRDGGWVCPHRGFNLASIAVRGTGRLLCPLHGLLIDPETGIVDAPAPPEVEGARESFERDALRFRSGAAVGEFP